MSRDDCWKRVRHITTNTFVSHIFTAIISVKYLWADETNPKPVDVSAPQYTQNLMLWIDAKFGDETLFLMEGNTILYFAR